MKFHGIKLDSALKIMIDHLEFNTGFHMECDDVIDEILTNEILKRHDPE